MPQLLDKYPYFKRLPTLAPVCAIILAGLLLHSSAFSATPPTEESGLHISVQYSFPIACNTYGASITIYENIFPNQGAPDKSKAADIDYYYCPHPIIDLVQMRKDFNALTPPTSNQKPDMSYSLPIHVDFLMDQVETELVAALSAKFNTAIPKSKIARLAFRGYEIFATIGGEEIVPYKIPLSLRGDPNTTFQDNLPYHVDFIITSTYPNLTSFVKTPILSARAFLSAAQVTTDVVSIVYEELDKDGFVQSMKGDGKLTQNVAYSADAEGGGFQIAGIGAGGAVSHGQETSKLDRYVTRHFVNKALQEGQAAIHINEYIESHGDKGGDFSSIAMKLVDFMITRMDHVHAEFVVKDNNTWDLINKTTGDALGLNMSLKDIAVATRGKDDFDASENASFGYGKVKASDQKQLKFGDSNDIKWKASGDILVPSTVDLYLLSQNTFKQRVQAYYSRNDIRAFNRQMLESSGPMTSSDYTGYMPPEIGTVVASVIPWEKQTAEFRQFWLPADGREAPHNTRYFALQSGLAVDSPSAALMQIMVPDLRGQFLRGLNQFATDHLPVAAVDPEKDRKVGSPQGDAVGPFTAKQTAFAFQADLLFQPGIARNYPAMVDVKDHPITTDSTETRPKNVAVYYYIKVN